MKTQVIYLEPQDDLQTIQDKINWGKSERVLVVYPTSSPPLRRKIDLVRLERFSRKKGSQFAVVTNRDDIRNFARELGISVFPNRRVAQLADWDQPPVKARDLDFTLSSKEEKEELKTKSTSPETPKWMESKYFRNWILSIAVIAILSVLFNLLPAADVQIAPKISLQSVQLEIRIDPDAETYNLAGIIPAEIVTVTVETEGSIPTTGRLISPSTYASGEVTFTNLTDQEYLIPAGTVIRTDSENPQKYLTVDDVHMAAEAGAEVTADVIAENPGVSGNAPAYSLTRLDGQLSFQASVSNQTNITGGKSVSNKAPSELDFEDLKTELLADLLLIAKNEAQNKTIIQDILISEILNNLTIISETYSPENIQPADELSLELVVEYEFLVIRGAMLNPMLEQILDSHLGSGQTARNNSLSIRMISSAGSYLKNSDTLTIRAQRQIYDIPDNFSIANSIKGKPVNDVVILLSDPDIYGAEPIISSKPYWWPWLPFSPQRINIEVVY
jgi:hypothetical protein